MTLTLSDAQLRDIADKLFLLKRPAPMKLPKPVITGPDSFTAKFAPIAADPRYKDMGIGVVDFTQGGFPKVWLHNGDRAWRIGSTCKLALHLAAVQLRDDMRELQTPPTKGLISSSADFDELFAMNKLWGLSRGADREAIQQIAGAGNAPRISTIFDLTKSPVDFVGPPPDADDIFGRLPVVGHRGGREIKHVTWETAGGFEFSELLWLAGAMSDNIAATACCSQIGLPYIKALMRAYGLFDTSQKMYLQLAGPLDPTNHNFKKEPILVDSSKPDGAKYRPLTYVERIAEVKDLTKDPKTGKFTDKRSWEPGSVFALTAYMIALMQDKLVDPSSFMLQPSERGIAGCETIRNNLANGGSHTIVSFLAQGVTDFVSGADITRQVTKIGILGEADLEPSGLICEFTYLETRERGSPPNTELKFAVLATGISGLIMAGTQGGADFLSKQLGEAVHLALLKP